MNVRTYTEILRIMAFQWGSFSLKALLHEPNMHGQQSSLQVTSLSVREVKKCGASGCYEVR